MKRDGTKQLQKELQDMRVRLNAAIVLLDVVCDVADADMVDLPDFDNIIANARGFVRHEQRG